MVKPTVIAAACAMLVSVAVGAPISPQTSCKELAESAQSSFNLTKKPDDLSLSGEIVGRIAMEMFPNHAHQLSVDSNYIFVAAFEKCKPTPDYRRVMMVSGSYETITHTTTVYHLSWEVGPNNSLAMSVIRDKTVASVRIIKAELKQGCVFTPGWSCTGWFGLEKRMPDGESYALVESKTYNKTFFFPAALNGEPVISNVWIDVPSA